MALWWGDNGDAIVAWTAHVLNTPYTTLLAEPIGRLLRFHEQAIAIQEQKLKWSMSRPN